MLVGLSGESIGGIDGEDGLLPGAQVVVQHRRAVDHRLPHVEHGRQHLVLDVDQLDRVLGDVRVGGADGGDSVALEQRLLAGHDAVEEVRQRRCRPLFAVVSAGCRLEEVLARDDGLDARQSQRP
jgi:hypothetical protein